MIYDANFQYEPVGVSDPFIYHRSCAEQAGRLPEWKPYTRQIGKHARCSGCLKNGRDVRIDAVTEIPPDEGVHF